MLYAKLRSCVHTNTKATYAAFSVHICIYIWCTRHFSVHVCHSHMDRIICSLLCDCLFPPLFSSFLLVYTNSIHSLLALQLLGISLEYDIWHMVAWISDISPNIHQVYLTYWWKFRHIHITWMVLRYTRLTLFQYYMIVPWCLPIFTAFISCTQCTPYVDILTWVFMYTKCILMLHISPQEGI